MLGGGHSPVRRKSILYSPSKGGEKRKFSAVRDLRLFKGKKVEVGRFKGLGEMSPQQLRETTIDPQTRRLVQLTVDAADEADSMLDMLLAKKRAADRREWLEQTGNLAEVNP